MSEKQPAHVTFGFASQGAGVKTEEAVTIMKTLKEAA
jgi:hypothetical protein